MTLSGSLVLYDNDPAEYGRAIESFLDGCDGFLYVVDNSAKPLALPLMGHPRLHYVYAGINLGFGRAHNFALSLVPDTSDAHLLLNPDVTFGPEVLPQLCTYLEDNPTVGAVMPRINYPNGNLQRVCKLLPTPVDLIFRRFIPSDQIKSRVNQRYEMHGLPQDRPSAVPTLSGCFLVVRTSLLKSLGGFDERYFMYMEDVDLVRRIGDLADTIYFPLVAVEHAYSKGSYRSKRLLRHHLFSALLYFNKWGWYFDRVRRQRNRLALSMLIKPANLS
jgi:GT2 family glycosyltransferase